MRFYNVLWSELANRDSFRIVWQFSLELITYLLCFIWKQLKQNIKEVDLNKLHSFVKRNIYYFNRLSKPYVYFLCVSSYYYSVKKD